MLSREVRFVHDEGVGLVQISVRRNLVTVLKIDIVADAYVMLLHLTYTYLLLAVLHKLTVYLYGTLVLDGVEYLKFFLCFHLEDESHARGKQ